MSHQHSTMTNNGSAQNGGYHIGGDLMTLQRIETFSAAHRLHSPAVTPEQNVEMFGKCNNLYGHGHNYTLEVAVTGPVDPVTGMVTNVYDLKAIIQRKVLDVVDHKNLDKEVEYFKKCVSTTENMARFIYNQIKPELPNGLQLRIVLRSTDKISVQYPATPFF